MRLLVAVLLLTVSTGYTQLPESSNIDITGDAAINVAPDRVRTDFGVETRNKVLNTAIAQNDAIVRRVIAAVREFHIEEGDIQTDSIHVEMAYDSHDGTVVDYYQVTKSVQVFLRDVSKFEPLLTGVLRAGANHIYDVQFSTSELRKYRDQARALAVKAAIEKANDLASAAGLKVAGKPPSVSSYSYGGGSSYGRSFGGGFNATQNVYQNGGRGVTEGTISLGKISVTASVAMNFRME